MKKLSLAAVVFFIWCTMAMAVVVPPGVYLACDPDPDAVEYIIEINGTEYGPMAPVKVKVAVTVIMEIGYLLVPGSLYTIRAKAVNALQSESEWTPPFEFYYSGAGIIVTTDTTPSPPDLIRLWIKE